MQGNHFALHVSWLPSQAPLRHSPTRSLSCCNISYWNYRTIKYSSTSKHQQYIYIFFKILIVGGLLISFGGWKSL